MTAEIVGLSSLIATNAAINIGIYKYFNARIERQNKEHDEKISRVYGRLDTHKQECEAKFVRKDVCSVLHNQTADNLAGLESRITEKFKEVGERITTMEKEVKGMFDTLIKLVSKNAM